jgi:hypothetical protein
MTARAERIFFVAVLVLEAGWLGLLVWLAAGR